MSERTRFCDDCSCVPKGVIAEVDNIEFMDSRELARRGITGLNTERGSAASLIAEITAVAVEVEDASSIDVGDEATLYVLAGSQTREDIEKSISECPGSKRTRVQKALGVRGTCQAIEPLSLK